MPTPPHGEAAMPDLSFVPEGACDAHLHILDARFPAAGPTPPGATLADYRAVQRRLGLSRAVLVQAKHHGTDPACLLEALAALGAAGRGIAVATPDISDAALRRLDSGGVRGLRFSLWNPADSQTSLEMLAPLAARIAPLGWHAQLHLTAEQIVDAAPILDALPCPMVFDHMARLPAGPGGAHPAFAVVARLLQQGRAWVKLSGAYLVDPAGPPWGAAGAIARAFLAEAPERLVWGSDWPHVTERHKPDAATLLGLLAEWAGKPVAARILSENAAALYGFADGTRTP
ncbi:amidohydrolase [Pseudoroseomonas cervicalis]|uniref:amidohydrolase family protein n=1 Tax=Teichococcus cervicalis TaxID=204525 RepID=UPI0022F1CA94|nr:amidohydrolase family protein [Pseudoroseomonas cervicalis]WBV45162.1 amidohydrolase family protein [Pseudoroseomonas cervicalis]